MMSTNPKSASSDPPAWMSDSPPSSKSHNGEESEEVKMSGGGKRGGGKAKKARRSSMGTTRSSYGGYESEEDEEHVEEDCCCCPVDPVLFGIAAFHMLCGLLGIAGIIANVYYMSRPSQHGHYQHLILRTYAVSFCATIVAIELDWRFIMKRIKLLDLWIFRGLFYVYAGLQTTGEIRCFTDLSEISRPEDVVGIALFVAGFFYTLMGTCCIKSVAESKRRSTKYREIDSELVESV